MASSERAETANATAASTTTAPAAPAAPTAAASSSATTADAGTGEERRGHGERQLSGAETATQTLKDGLRCDLLMNARYHSVREAFLDSVHRVLMFLIIVLGAAAISNLFNAPFVKEVFAACAAVFAALDLTADLSNRARQHALMKRRYFEMLADLTTGQSPVEIEAKMHRCSAEEEPAFHALLSLSWNAAQEMVYGDYADKYPVPLRHRLLKNVRRYAEVSYKPIKGPRPAPA
jgi:hypothetical protein